MSSAISHQSSQFFLYFSIIGLSLLFPKNIHAQLVCQAPNLVKNIHPNPMSGSNPRNLTDVNSLLFFSAEDLTNGEELWGSDGSDGGTRLVKDIRPGNNDASLEQFVAFNGKLFFSANDGERINSFKLYGSWTNPVVIRGSLQAPL